MDLDPKRDFVKGNITWNLTLLDDQMFIKRPLATFHHPLHVFVMVKLENKNCFSCFNDQDPFNWTPYLCHCCFHDRDSYGFFDMKVNYTKFLYIIIVVVVVFE